jgi:hypothetical protein
MLLKKRYGKVEKFIIPNHQVLIRPLPESGQMGHWRYLLTRGLNLLEEKNIFGGLNESMIISIRCK